MKKNNNDIFELMTKIYNEIQEIIKRLSNIKNSTSKNSILLEKVDNNIKLLAANSISSSVTNMNDTIEVVKNITANNYIDILENQRKSAI